MSTGKRNKTEMAPSYQKNRKNQDQKTEPLKTGDKAQPTAEQIRIAQIIDTKAEDPTLKDKVKQVMEATKRSEDEVITALHDCDNDPDAAVAVLLEGGQMVGWSTSKKKKSKPPVDKSKETSTQNSNSKATNNNAASPAGEIEDWNDETENADDNPNQNKVNSLKGKAIPSRPFRGSSSRPFNKRGAGRPNAPRDGFNRSGDNSDWSKGNFKPPRGGGRNFFKSRNGPQKDGDSFDNKEISERLGQNDHSQDKHNSGGSDWGSDTSDHNKNSNQNTFHSKSGDMKEDNKWQEDNYWNKSQSRGRGGGGMRNRSYNSYNRQSDENNDTRGGFNKGGRGRGRFQGSRNRGEGRGGRWEDGGGGFRGRMSNGPSRGSWRGGRPSRSMSNKPIETWTPITTKDEEDWDQEEEIFTGEETKVFTPSTVLPIQASSISEPPKLIQDSPQKEERSVMASVPSDPVPPPVSMPVTGQQFLAQLTQNASNIPKSIPQSVFNEVHLLKNEINTSDYGSSFGMNSYSENETSSDQSKQQLPRARLPPPSKIPSSAVEMPPDVGSGITLLDVQFGALELEQPAEPVTAAAPPTPSPPPPQPEAQVQAPPPQVSTELPVYQRPAIQDLLTKSEPPPSTYYQDSYQTQYPKTTHQTSYSSSYSQPSYNNSQSIYSTGLGNSNNSSLSNHYQNYSGQLSRHSALTSTTNSKELDMPTPSVNISPPSAKPKVVPVPPGVAAPPALVNPQYIVNQPYIQPSFYSLEDLQIIQGGRLPHVPEYYTYTNPPSNAPREFDTRFPTQDTSTSPAPPNATPSQNQTLMNPHIPYFAYYGGGVIGNYPYSTPIYPIAAGSSTGNQHQTTNAPYGKTPGNYNAGPSYTGGTGNYDNQAAPAGGDYNKARDPVGVNKVTQGVYQVSQPSATNNLTNIYSKTYDKHNFNCATPPPPPTYTLGSQSSIGGGYSAQGLFYSAVNPHHQPLHQPMDTAQSRNQLGAPPAKPQPKQKYPISPYWHQQN